MANTTQTSSDQIKLILFTNSQELESVFESKPFQKYSFNIVPFGETPNDLAEIVADGQPHAVLLDLAGNKDIAFDYLSTTSQAISHIPNIAIVKMNAIELAQEATLAGAKAFLLQPFESETFDKTIHRVIELQAHAPGMGETPPEEESNNVVFRSKRTIVVYSPRGGVGTTTIAINLAIAIQHETKKRVILLDGKPFFGHVDVGLNLISRNTIENLIQHSKSLDDAILKSVISEHTSGIDVLPASNTFSNENPISAEDLYNIIIGLQEAYDYVVIDAGSQLTENVVTMMDLASKIVMLLGPDIPSVKSIRQFLSLRESLWYPPEKILLTLNREGEKGGIPLESLKDNLEQDLFATIPFEEGVGLRSFNRGVPIIIQHPNNKISQAITKAAKDLLGLIQLESNKSFVSNRSAKDFDLLSKSSRFG